MWRATVLSIFPEMFPGPLGASLAGKALASRLWALEAIDIPALALLDACVRLLPGVVGAEASIAEESFTAGLLEYPQYTRPQVWEGRTIPDVLTSGDHGKVAAWRRQQAENLTKARRPDLWADY